GSISRSTLASPLSRDRGDVDNAPAALIDHGSCCRLAAQERPRQVHAQLQLPFLQRGGQQRLIEANARIVDQYVEPLELGQRLVDQPLDFGRLAYVDALSHGLPARAAD